jgi:hypothetical protein
MRKLIALAAAAALCLASPVPGQIAPPSVAAPGTTSKICGAPDGAATIVAYAKACPPGTHVVGKICPDGNTAPYSVACSAPLPPEPMPTPAPPAPATTQKICTAPSGEAATIPYAQACPPGTRVTAKICPSGVLVAYSASCAAAPPPPPPPAVPPVAGQTATALQSCPSLTNPLDALTAGQRYQVEGIGGTTVPRADGSATVSGPEPRFVVLSQASSGHFGDGWSAFYVPIACVRAG